ncbi:HEAT repeat domain-containing protein [Streptomyces sp. ISL-43]|uniref:HEAT repeat domain-containing protein n=1 Tax=Streptomyces sp. ISL-43 TaxID=2819183 RepID=UPI001BE6B85D|nr:HEAT repeat domain-containing protein [Streptomyces sp. ISL-43]MBT2452260.1 HEAT repeat domain-containing protein [Streptomyces sp. ISL-43]
MAGEKLQEGSDVGPPHPSGDLVHGFPLPAFPGRRHRGRAEEDPRPEVRFSALRWWVVRAGDEEGEALAAARAVAEPDPEVRRRVVHMLALGWPSGARTAAVLRDLALRDEDEETRAVAEDLLVLAVNPDG